MTDSAEQQELFERNPEIPQEILTGIGLGPSKVFYDASFRQKKKKGKFREVEAPMPAPYGVIADTHAHLDCVTSAPLSLARCAVHNVGFICTIVDIVEDRDTTFNHLDQWKQSAQEILQNWGKAELASSIPHIRIAAGCHPHNAKSYNDQVEEFLLERLKDPRVCAIGEVGLDYYYDKSPREAQREVFRCQIRLAHKTGLPLILHMREAHDEGYEILKEEGFPQAGVLLHCFNLDKEVLAPWVEAGSYIAFGGPLTFKNCDYVRESASLVPRDKILTETDSPYMTPEPLRGIECGPEHTIFTASFMAHLFGCNDAGSRDELFAQLFSNAQNLLNRELTKWQVTGESL